MVVDLSYDLNGDNMMPYYHKKQNGEEAYRPNATDIVRAASSGIRGLFSGSSSGEWDFDNAEAYETVDSGREGSSQTWGNDVEFDSNLFPTWKYTGNTTDSYFQFQNYVKSNISNMLLESFKKRFYK